MCTCYVHVHVWCARVAARVRARALRSALSSAPRKSEGQATRAPRCAAILCARTAKKAYKFCQMQMGDVAACCSGLRDGNVYFWYVLIKILAVRPRHIKVRPVPERSIIEDHSMCRWLSGSASRSQAERLKLLK